MKVRIRSIRLLKNACLHLNVMSKAVKDQLPSGFVSWSNNFESKSTTLANMRARVVMATAFFVPRVNMADGP